MVVTDRRCCTEQHLCFSHIGFLSIGVRMVTERTAGRCEKEQDSQEYTTRDAGYGDLSKRIPGWIEEANMYFSYARRARQYCGRNQDTGRYL